MITNNVTTLERMKGTRLARNPFLCMISRYMPRFDMGVPYNLVQVLGFDVLSWGLPTVPNLPYMGLFFPDRPELTEYEEHKLKQGDIK